MSNYTEGFTSTNGDTTDATEIEAELDKVATAVNSKIDADGSGTMSGDLNMGSQNITNLADPTAAQDAATKNNVDTAEVASFAAVGTTTISTTEVSEDELSITIPSDWSGYNVEATATAYITETGTASGNSVISVRIREGSGTGGTVIGRCNTGVGDAVPNNTAPIAIMGYLDSETATGSITFSLTTETSDNNNDFSLTQARWRIRARRTS